MLIRLVDFVDHDDRRRVTVIKYSEIVYIRTDVDFGGTIISFKYDKIDLTVNLEVDFVLEEIERQLKDGPYVISFDEQVPGESEMRTIEPDKS